MSASSGHSSLVLRAYTCQPQTQLTGSQCRAACKGLAPHTHLTTYHNDLPWQKEETWLQFSAVNPGKRKDVPSRTETDSHPIKLGLFDMPNLTAPWEAASIRYLLRGDVSTPAGNSTHTERPCLSENEDCAMAALLHFITRLKDFVLEKTSLGRKKSKFWLAPAFPTINLSKATDRGFGNSDEDY